MCVVSRSPPRVGGSQAKSALFGDTNLIIRPRSSKPCFQETKDGASCVILFPSQRQQVLRLLRDSAAQAAPQLDRACSALYGPGASRYSAELMASWQAGGVTSWGLEFYGFYLMYGEELLDVSGRTSFFFLDVFVGG